MNPITRTSDLHLLPNRFFLFSFGANDEINLAKRFFGHPNEKGTTKEINTILKHTLPAFLPGYLRSFFGHSDAWDGSVGTLIKTNTYSSGTYGLLTEITQRGQNKFFIGKKKILLKNLGKVENIDGGMYILQKITQTTENIPVYAFVGCAERYKNNIVPSKRYLNAVGRTIHRSFPEAKEIHIPIRLGEKKHVICSYKYIS